MRNKQFVSCPDVKIYKGMFLRSIYDRVSSSGICAFSCLPAVPSFVLAGYSIWSDWKLVELANRQLLPPAGPFLDQIVAALPNIGQF